ncbi:MAG TPA: MFS transporter [Steroidobacteraceae bacterium]|nr:MFS transporter [Steroidobacteraceae bacterium]
MEKQELRAVGSLAAVFSVRLLGLFMIYPVFADYARQLAGATSFKIGLALGIYGLSQGLLQIPFGLLSDRVGRKLMIVIGLILFGAGSAVAAASSTIDGVIVGRVVQGAGAVGSVILALVADLTGEESRTKAMAIVGLTIGGSFMLALVTGPVLSGLVGVAGIFWTMVALALVGIAITLFIVPRPLVLAVHRDAETVPSLLRSIIRNTELRRLDFGVFALHAMLTASFLRVPALLRSSLDVDSRHQWMVYLPVLLVSVAVMVPAIIVAEKHRRMKTVFVAAVACLALSQCLFLAGSGAISTIAAITVFFAGFNVMEASLPSLVTKTAPPAAKGTAAGIFSTSQFLGIFVGGVCGGWMLPKMGGDAVFVASLGLALIWLVVAATMKPPSYLTTKLLRISEAAPADGAELAARLRRVPGVHEAVVISQERLAYLKVDSRSYDAALARSVVAAAVQPAAGAADLSIL